MAEPSTLARPYARAAFEHARERDALARWSGQLRLAAAVAATGAMARALGNPGLTARQQADALIDVCGDGLDDAGRNFMRLLSANKRLPLLPTISALFERDKADHEKTVAVTVHSAFELRDETLRALAGKLEDKLGREVRIETRVDADLLGGILIRAGDLAIDGSARWRLSLLSAAMNS